MKALYTLTKMACVFVNKIAPKLMHEHFPVCGSAIVSKHADNSFPLPLSWDLQGPNLPLSYRDGRVMNPVKERNSFRS
jgi:hypothetical protein